MQYYILNVYTIDNPDHGKVTISQRPSPWCYHIRQ